MEKVFIYWDNSNIFHEAQRIAENLVILREGPDARYRVRIQFDNIWKDRQIKTKTRTKMIM